MLAAENFSTVKSHDAINELVGECHGLMTLEHTFIGAFTNIKKENCLQQNPF